MKIFEKVATFGGSRSVFDLSHEHKTSINFGELVPVVCMEIIPGDKIKLTPEAIIKMQPMLAPIMHQISTNMEFFFVPNRLIWDGWEDFITKGITGTESPNFPKLVGTKYQANVTFTQNSLADYLGIPVTMFTDGTSNPLPEGYSQLPFRAYQKIYNDWYRNQNFVNEIPVPTDSLDITLNTQAALYLTTLRKRNFEDDYFTACLPAAQRGNPVKLPLGTTAPVSGIALAKAGSTTMVNSTVATNSTGNFASGTGGSTSWTLSNLNADLSNATAATVNELRIAMKLQTWYEMTMRFGSRYKEVLRGMFNVKSSDSRLDYSEYIGGGRLPIRIAEVIQTSETSSTPQGTMSGKGGAAGIFNGFTKEFEEHGFLIGIMSCVQKTGYFQGMPKMFTKFDTFDYPFPQFMHLGEEAVRIKELYYTNSTDVNDVFGYMPRYMSDRCIMDRVSGEFRSNLLFWHMTRKFTSKPSLNFQFTECTSDNRIFPVVSDQFKKILVMLYFNITAVRQLSKYAVPQ